MRRKLEFEEIFKDRPSVDDLKNLERKPIIALIDNIRSMHNVGSIFRSSDGARIEKLLLSGFTPSPPRPEISKTALGATDSVPWAYVDDSVSKIEELKKAGYTIYVVEQTSDSTVYSDVQFKFPLCFIVGNEVDGVSDSLVQLADHAIELPMLGLKHSLNVSVAYGIVLYNILSKSL
ncbi:MAG: TrmH family RNA methyltransferase [Calditrichaeota bacterium]|nr:MAG: TrmH family RNA methyltransferase [Calditrichota bacterium]MBL1206772.1 TrmH family RNA methyltransferase [Calditrichota bacterium]NOG46598.1 RNA methyltransferase [Calditrichota bacterium]